MLLWRAIVAGITRCPVEATYVENVKIIYSTFEDGGTEGGGRRYNRYRWWDHLRMIFFDQYDIQQ